MELKNFIAETLKEVIAGVLDAQQYAKECGAYINPLMTHTSGKPDIPLFIYETENGKVYYSQMVEFDIALTTATKDSERGKVGVVTAILNAGVQGENEDTNSEVSRIKFSVPVMFPLQDGPPRLPPFSSRKY